MRSVRVVEMSDSVLSGAAGADAWAGFRAFGAGCDCETAVATDSVNPKPRMIAPTIFTFTRVAALDALWAIPSTFADTAPAAIAFPADTIAAAFTVDATNAGD